MPRIRQKSRSRDYNVQVSNPPSSVPSLSEIYQERNMRRKPPRVAKGSTIKNDEKCKALSTPTTSCHDGWTTKERDLNNNNSVEQLLYPKDLFNTDSAVVTKMTRKKPPPQACFIEKRNMRIRKSNSTATLRKLEGKQENIAGKIQPAFSKFVVDYEVPSKKGANNKRTMRRRRGDGSSSQQSVNVRNSNNLDPYSKVLSKVDSRWNQVDVHRHILKISSHNVLDGIDGRGNKANNRPKAQVSERPSILKQSRSNLLAPSIVEIPLQRKGSKGEKIVKNYPAFEIVKNTKDKLPLTIPPKYNFKKVIELTNREIGRSTNSRPKVKKKRVTPFKSTPVFENTYDREEQQNSKIVRFDNYLNDSILDLQQISPTANSMMLSLPTNARRVPMMGSDARESSIDDGQPSTFLAAKISIQRRMNKIRFSDGKDESGKIPKYNMFVEQQVTTLPLLNIRKSLRSFPIPWPCSMEQQNTIMANVQKGFSLTKKARNRKNTLGIGYANRIFPDDGGASSPINLLYRSSLAELDPEETTTIPRRKSSLHVKSNSVLSNKSSESLCSEVAKRSRRPQSSPSKHRVRISEVHLDRDVEDVNGNAMQSSTQSSVCRLLDPPSQTNSRSSSKSSIKSFEHSPSEPRRVKKKKSKPVVGEFQRLHQVMSKSKVNMEEVDLFSARSLHDVTEKISAVNDAVFGGIVDMVKAVANMFTFNSFAQVEDSSENTD